MTRTVRIGPVARKTLLTLLAAALIAPGASAGGTPPAPGTRDVGAPEPSRLADAPHADRGVTPTDRTTDDGQGAFASPLLDAADALETALRTGAISNRSWVELVSNPSPMNLRSHSAEVESWLAWLAPELDALTLAAIRHGELGMDYTLLVPEPEGAARLRHVGHLLAMRAMLAAEAGDIPVALADLDRLAALSERFASEPTHLMHGLAIEGRRTTAIVVRSILESDALTPERFARLEAAYAGTAGENAMSQVQDALLAGHDHIVDLAGDDLREAHGERPEIDDSLRGTRARARRLADAWERYASLPRYRRGDAPDTVAVAATVAESRSTGEPSGTLAPVAAEKAARDARSIGTWADGVFLELSDANENALLRIDVDRTRTLLATTAIALERYATQHGGRYPRALEGLVPAYMPERPVDPFSGDGLLYERRGDGYRMTASGAARSAHAAIGAPDRDPVLVWERTRER